MFGNNSHNSKLGFISIVANINDKLNFTDSTGAACNFTIPASPLYSPSALVNALNVLFSTARAGVNCNIVASFNTTTNYFHLKIQQQLLHLHF